MVEAASSSPSTQSSAASQSRSVQSGGETSRTTSTPKTETTTQQREPGVAERSAAAKDNTATPTKDTAEVARDKMRTDQTSEQMRMRAEKSADEKVATEKASETAAATKPKETPAAGDPKFDALSAGPKKADAPDKVQVPKEMNDGLKKGWDGSFPGGRSQEQGGILVQNKDGSHQWKPAPAGNSGSIGMNYGDVGKDQKLVAAGHTHPYDKTEGNERNVAFSKQDMSRMVTAPESMHMVRSGDSQFMIAKSDEFNKRVAGLDDTGKAAMARDMNRTWQTTFDNTKGTFQEKVDAAVRKVGSDYGLIYYRGGADGNLTRQ